MGIPAAGRRPGRLKVRQFRHTLPAITARLVPRAIHFQRVAEAGRDGRRSGVLKRFTPTNLRSTYPVRRGVILLASSSLESYGFSIRGYSPS